MSHLKNTLGAGAAAMAMAFGSIAPALADGGLINDSGALIRYAPALSKTLAAATGDDLTRLAAGGFMVGLEAKLKPEFDTC